MSTRIIAASVLTAGLALGAAAPAFAALPFAPPGDNGTVKIHSPETPEEDDRNEPKVCEFQIVGSGFDPAQEVTWQILTQGGSPSSRELVLEGELDLDGEGTGSTDLLRIDNGHYRLEWTFEGQKGNAAKHKVFKVVCEETEEPEPTPEPSTPPTGEPTEEPTGEPTAPPETEEPTVPPTDDPSAPETEEPTVPATPTSPEGEKPGESPAPSENEPSLALTGSAIAGLVAAGLAAAGGGGAALYFSRKRKAE
ncbi:hypothetical protein [Nocardiopsis lambiniae]|uniref:LPXTG cell wall anchor domain-containing protein n=1 Tax=Nocardiopsis lambiniae TaxID=3075539 RepID=A0ABU2MH88_9ACTN|nr:hypothetical protein [Nocardiopsis sp. DSM 44743]MDT0332070.1 hypothetical protein [Nocardiopsis sp. DSM 44743]